MWVFLHWSYCCLCVTQLNTVLYTFYAHNRQVPAQLIDASDFIFDIHRQLVPLHEEWVGGIKLAPTNIYGIRVNRNGSALALHYDKVSDLSQLSAVNIQFTNLWRMYVACFATELN